MRIPRGMLVLGWSGGVRTRRPPTTLLVNRDLWNPGASAPRCNFGRLVHQSLEARATPAVVLQREDNAQMFRQTPQCLDVLLDQLGRSVVVVIDGIDAVDDGMIGLADPNVEGEEGVDDDVDEKVEL